MLSHLQQNLFENEAHLSTAQERINQLTQDVKFIETEYLNSRAMM